jgi:[protein-PII] uridylyltransferase
MAEPAADFRDARAKLLAQTEVTGAALRQALTDLADRWLTGLLGDAGDVALVAVGGYGRREPAPGSDLDLILLHRDGVEVTALAESIWYPVWDAGVGLDHSVRTVGEAVGVADQGDPRHARCTPRRW